MNYKSVLTEFFESYLCLEVMFQPKNLYVGTSIF